MQEDLYVQIKSFLALFCLSAVFPVQIHLVGKTHSILSSKTHSQSRCGNSHLLGYKKISASVHVLVIVIY